jgi:hypothetical protein
MQALTKAGPKAFGPAIFKAWDATGLLVMILQHQLARLADLCSLGLEAV